MGLDIPAVHGTAILASGGGRVISAGYRGPYGNAIVIDHGDGLQTLYGHCSKLFVHTGDLVMPQQRIASVGSTGRSTGPHLHFEVIRDGKRVAPGQVLSSVLARNSAP
jgi:murein DD-endopeptidase MepM/ murein hydrolase activator NlpD